MAASARQAGLNKQDYCRHDGRIVFPVHYSQRRAE